jgi:hypothetical protein
MHRKRLMIGVIDGADRDQTEEDGLRSAASTDEASGDGRRKQDGCRSAGAHRRGRYRDGDPVAGGKNPTNRPFALG